MCNNARGCKSSVLPMQRDSTNTEGGNATDGLAFWTVEQLRETLCERGLQVPGNKELLEQLVRVCLSLLSFPRSKPAGLFFPS